MPPQDQSNWREEANRSVSDFVNPDAGTAHDRIDYELEREVLDAFPGLGGIAEWIYNNMDLSEFQKTYMPGEAELTSRLLGIGDRVDPYMYAHTVKPKEEAFTQEVLSGEAPQSIAQDWPAWADYETFEDMPWEGMMTNVWNPSEEKYEKEPMRGKSYDPSESPLKEISPNIFEVNEETVFGQNWKDRLDFAYSSAKAQGRYKDNPDRGDKRMLFYEEQLLGDVFFEEDGSFEDVWNVDLDEWEKVIDRYTDESGETQTGINKANFYRYFGSPFFQRNIPIIRGKASDRSINDFLEND
jgi:hypothetical protein